MNVEYELREHGKKLLKVMHDEYESVMAEGYSEDDALDRAFMDLNNYDWLAVIWAAGAVDDAVQAEEVRTAIEAAVLWTF